MSELEPWPIEGEIVGAYEKLIQDGKVAVLYSPGYVAGWSTWNGEAREAMVFDRELVEAVLAMTDKERKTIGNHWYDKEAQDTPVMRVIGRKFPGIYSRGVYQFQVEWVEEGSRFEIEEYDGSESVRVFGPDEGFRA